VFFGLQQQLRHLEKRACIRQRNKILREEGFHAAMRYYRRMRKAIVVEETEDQAMASEADSQSAYENFMKDSNKSIKKTQQSISDMTGARASAKEELSIAKSDFSSNMQELEGLDQTNQDLHKSCDYTLKNFDARQKARAAEMDALNEAKNILSGAK